MIARANFVSTLVAGGLWNSDHQPDLWRLAEHYRKSGSLEQSVEWLAELIYGKPMPSAAGAALAAAEGKNEKNKLPTALAVLLSHLEAQLA